MSFIRPPSTAIAGLLLIGLSACGGTSAASQRPATPTPRPTPPPLAAPVMIQVENASQARPQSGLDQADVVYEYETEGGISRFSALFFKAPSQPIGPVRSARLATIKLVQVYDATLLYSGGSQYVVQVLNSSGVRQFDETSAQGALFRNGSRSAPHNLYTDGGHLAAFDQRVGRHTVGYQLWTRTTALPPGGTPAPKFEVPVSQSETPSFTYDAAGGGYQRAEPDTGVSADANTSAPWEAKTIVVLPVQVTQGPEVEDVSGAYGLDFGIVGAGEGQLAVGGKLYAIKWTQTASGPPQLTLANGQPAPVAPGQVLIELVSTGKTVSVE